VERYGGSCYVKTKGREGFGKKRVPLPCWRVRAILKKKKGHRWWGIANTKWGGQLDSLGFNQTIACSHGWNRLV